MIRQPISYPLRIALGLLSVIVIVGSYAVLSHKQHRVNPQDTTIPDMAQFQQGLSKILTPDGDGERWLWADAKASLTRLALGMFAGILLAFLAGMAMGCLPIVEAFLGPPISFLAKIPPTAMLAVYFVVFGTDIKLFVAMVALGIFPSLAQSIFQAARKDVRDHSIHKAYTLGATNFEVIADVVFRQILPRILENIRLQVGPAFVFLIAAEWMLADVGFGYRLRIQSRLLNMSVVYAYLVILAGVGFGLDWTLSWMRRKLCPWFGE